MLVEILLFLILIAIIAHTYKDSIQRYVTNKIAHIMLNKTLDSIGISRSSTPKCTNDTAYIITIDDKEYLRIHYTFNDRNYIFTTRFDSSIVNSTSNFQIVFRGNDITQQPGTFYYLTDKESVNVLGTLRGSVAEFIGLRDVKIIEDDI